MKTLLLPLIVLAGAFLAVACKPVREVRPALDQAFFPPPSPDSVPVSSFFETPCSRSVADCTHSDATPYTFVNQCPTDGSAPALCIEPLGTIDPRLINQLVTYYKDTYGLQISILLPSDVDPAEVRTRGWEVDAGDRADFMKGGLGYSRSAETPFTVIGLTSLALYDADDANNNYVFGVKNTPDDPNGVLSTFNMDPRTYGLPQDDAFIFLRMSNMLSRYIAFLYYGMPLNNDPTSVLTSSIGGLDDLDAITGGLPTPAP